MNIKKVKTEGELREYLPKLYYTGIVVMNDIILTEPLFIERNDLLFCCAHSRKLYWENFYYASPNRLYEEMRTEASPDDHSAIHVLGNNITFGNNFRILGREQIYTGDWRADGIQSGIKLGSSKQLVNNIQFMGVDITAFNHSGIWAFNCLSTTVVASYMAGLRDCPYYNYLIWLGGKGGARNQRLLVFNNPLLEHGRHVIGSSGHPNSYWAIGNVIGGGLKHRFDRHGLVGPKGGMHTVIADNRFLSPNNYYFSVVEPEEGGSIQFYNNTCAKTGDKPTGEIEYLPSTAETKVSLPVYANADYQELPWFTNKNNQMGITPAL